MSTADPSLPSIWASPAVIHGALTFSTTLLCGVVRYVWLPARGVAGLRVWAHRLALCVPRTRASDPLLQLCAADRARQRRELAIALCCGASVALWLIAGASELSLLLPLAPAIRSWLLLQWSAMALCLLAAAPLLREIARVGLPQREHDERATAEQVAALRQEVARTAQKLAPQGDDELLRSTVEQICTATPPQFLSLLRGPVGDCLRGLQPQLFQHERECVEYLQSMLKRVRTHSASKRIDVLALCVDSTPYAQQYWADNMEAARAGVYISRIFVYDDANELAMTELAAEQSRAGVSAYLISRAVLEPLLRDVYKSELFGFTIMQGDDLLDAVVLHQGTGAEIHAAAYQTSLLTGFFAALHTTIRKQALSTRAPRSQRLLDASRTRVQIKVRGQELDAVRLDYELTRRGCSSMSIALSRWNGGRNLRRDDQVFVKTSELAIYEWKPMLVSHFHHVDLSVCGRRQHTSCRAVSEGDYVVGLRELG